MSQIKAKVDIPGITRIIIYYKIIILYSFNSPHSTYNAYKIAIHTKLCHVTLDDMWSEETNIVSDSTNELLNLHCPYDIVALLALMDVVKVDHCVVLVLWTHFRIIVFMALPLYWLLSISKCNLNMVTFLLNTDITLI